MDTSRMTGWNLRKAASAPISCVFPTAHMSQGFQRMWPWGWLSVSLTKASSSTKLSFRVWDVFSFPLAAVCPWLFFHCPVTVCLYIHSQILGEHLELLLVKGHLQFCCKKPRGYWHSVATSVLRDGVVVHSPEQTTLQNQGKSEHATL